LAASLAAARALVDAVRVEFLDNVAPSISAAFADFEEWNTTLCLPDIERSGSNPQTLGDLELC
jgi:hypothetical protein